MVYIGLFIISIILIFIAIFTLLHTHKINTEVSEENIKLEEKNKELKLTKTNLENELYTIDKSILQRDTEFKNETQKLNDLKESIDNVYKDKEEMSKKAFENFCNILDENYEEKSREYTDLILTLDKTYEDKQLTLMKEVEKINAELEDIKRMRTAAIEAQLREKEIDEQLDFYCLTIPNQDLVDIGVLESIKPKLNNSRVLCMLIWQTFWQKPLKALSANILGNKVKIGIYKITNIKTKECYIGQSVDVAKRFSEHAKCGLGIDTPQGNKLYKAMQEYGLQSFSWELLEECDKTQLDEKERYYINLYDAYNYGYNSNKGVNKK